MTVNKEEGLDLKSALRSKKVRLKTPEEKVPKFKKRDLRASQVKRIKCKINGTKVCHERLKTLSLKDRDQYFNQLILDNDYVFPYYYKKEDKKEESNYQVDNQEEMEEAQDLRLKREYEEWMRGRYKLVADVKNMGLNYEWLYNKPVKSAVEERVMIKLMQQNKREMEKEKLREIRQNNKKLKSHRFEDTFYLKKECSKSTMEKNKKLLQKIQVQALPSAESSISNLPPINHAANSDVVQMKQDRRKIEYTTVGNQLVVRNENIRIPQELISRNELMRNVEHARQKVGIKKLTTESFLESIRNESSENRDPLRDLINIYPNFDDVIPEKEEMKLSTGQAFVEPKVNCWMTFEEMKEKLKNYGKDITPKMKHYILSRHAYWPGGSDNTRINYNNNDDRSNSLFHHTRRMNRRRCNYGYDNEINIWPVGDAIIYGDITRGRSYQIGWNDL